MARYIGPKTRMARRFGEAIYGPDKVLAKRNYPPGQHGNNRRRKTSEYGVMLAEKQKAKYTYGVLERQFRNMFKKAAATSGITGEILLQNLECRLGQIIAVREKSKSLEVINDSLAGFNHSKYPWIEWDENVKGGKLLHKPERADIPENIREQLIVELYSKN